MGPMRTMGLWVNNNVPNASAGPQHVLPPIQHIPNTTLPPQSYPNQY